MMGGCKAEIAHLSVKCTWLSPWKWSWQSPNVVHSPDVPWIVLNYRCILPEALLTLATRRPRLRQYVSSTWLCQRPPNPPSLSARKPLKSSLTCLIWLRTMTLWMLRQIWRSRKRNILLGGACCRLWSEPSTYGSGRKPSALWHPPMLRRCWSWPNSGMGKRILFLPLQVSDSIVGKFCYSNFCF